MITENENKDDNNNFRGLENKVPQNRSLNDDYEDYQDSASKSEAEEELGNPVNNGGVEAQFDPRLEEQWQAVRDEYLANYPDLKDTDTEYEEGSFYKVIYRLAKKRERTPDEIQNEIMDWSVTK